MEPFILILYSGLYSYYVLFFSLLLTFSDFGHASDRPTMSYGHVVRW